MDNSLQMVSYYAFHEMMKPVSNINRIMTAALFFLLTGMLYMVLYYCSILRQLKILTEKLKQVEKNTNSATRRNCDSYSCKFIFYITVYLIS